MESSDEPEISKGRSSSGQKSTEDDSLEPTLNDEGGATEGCQDDTGSDSFTDLVGQLDALWKAKPQNDDSQAANGQTAVPTSLNGSRSLEDAFEMHEVLGVGGVGIVHRAYDRNLKRFVAVKTLTQLALHSAANRTRFQLEAEAAAKLDHPGIVSVFEFGESDGTPWYAMALVDGQTLEDVISQQLQLDGRFAAKLIQLVCEAVAYAHGQGVIHRDIKPSNILIDKNGTPLISDFGLAKLIDSDSQLTGTGDIVGTAAYMSPEQARGETDSIDERADLYALGAVLYHCIVGRRPFQAAHPVEIIRKVCQEEPLAPRQLNPEIDHDIETICLRCLEKKPDLRFQTAAELTDELQRYLDHQPILSRPLGVPTRLIRWCNRKPYIASSIALACLLIALIAGGIPSLMLLRTSRQNAMADAILQRELAESHAAIAVTANYFSGLAEIHQRMSDKRAGWRQKSLVQLNELIALDVDGRDEETLKSLLANILSRPDLERIHNFPKTLDIGCAAFSPDGSLLALGETRAKDDSSDLLIHVFKLELDPDEFVQVIPYVQLNLFADVPYVQRVYNRVSGGGWESAKCLCFSSDNQKLAVGTRHGRILEWNLSLSTANATTKPHVVNSFGSGEQDRCAKLCYASNHQLLVAHHWESRKIKFFDTSTCTNTWTGETRCKGFEVVDQDQSQEHLIAFNDKKQFTVTDFESPQEKDFHQSQKDWELLAKSASGNSWAAAIRSDGENEASIVDIGSGRKTVLLRSRDGEPNSVMNLQFGPQSATLVGEMDTEGQNSAIRLWDAISGVVACDLPLNVDPSEMQINLVHSKRRLLLLGMHEGSSLFRIVSPQARPLVGPTVQATVPDHSDIFAAHVYGPRRIAAFDLDAGDQFLAILERESEGQEEAGVRVCDLKSGAQVQRWLIDGLPQDVRPSQKSHGADVIFADEPFGPDGNLYLASAAAGFLCRLSPSGFQPLPQQSLPLIYGIRDQVSGNRVTYRFPFNGPTKDVSRWMTTVVFRLNPAALKKINARVETVQMQIKLTMGEETVNWNLNSAALSLGGEFWQLNTHGLFADRTIPSPILLELSCGQVPLLILDADGDEGDVPDLKAHRDASQPPVIEIRTPMLVSDPTKNYWLGPMAKISGGDLFAIDGGDEVYRWNAASGRTGKWQDTRNSWASIRDVAAGKNSIVVGTRFGNVFQVRETDSDVTAWREKQIDSLNRAFAGGETAKEIVAVAMTRDDRTAVSGNRDGELMLHDLSASVQQSECLRFHAHQRSISGVAISPDGSWVVSASIDRSLKFWRRTGNALTLDFQMADMPNYVIDMKFATHGNTLFFLCQGERGIRTINLNRMSQNFADAGIGKIF